MTTEKDVRSAIGRLDRRIAAQVAPILDHPKFRRLRRAWEGLHHLVRTSRTGEMLKVRVLNVTRDEMREEFDEFRGKHWRQAAFYKQFHDMVYGGFGGGPFGLIVQDGEVGDGPEDAVLLDDLNRIAREAHAPLIVAAADGAAPDERDLVFRLRLSAAWKLTPLAGGLEVMGRLER